MKKNKWLDLVASEVMDSRGAMPLINEHVYYTREKIGHEPESVLVVGCADGTELDMWQYSKGIDLNDESLAKCGTHIVQNMDMHEMSFEDNCFELVSLRDVYEHSVSHIQALSEIARVSSKYVAITLPGQDWQNSDWHYIIPTLEQMIALGEKTGLMLKSYRRFNTNMGTMSVNQDYYLFKKE